MHKGGVELNVEADEKAVYALAGNGSGGLIGLVTATPSFSQSIGGNTVTSVPAYKVFIVLLSGEDTQAQGISDNIPSGMPYAGVAGIAVVILIVILLLYRHSSNVSKKKRTIL